MPSWHNLIKYLKNCDTSHDLQNILYTKKNKTLWYLPSTFNTSHGHVRGSQYVVLIYSNLILTPNTSFNPVEFGWNSVDSVLMPSKFIVTLPEMYTATCEYKEKYTRRCQCSKSAALSTEFCICNGEECCT